MGPSPPSLRADTEAARRLHRELNACPARRGRTRPRDEAAQGAAVKEEEAEAEEVKIRAVEWWPVVKAEQVEEVEIRAVEWVGEGGKRRRVKREEGGTAEAGPSGRGAGRRAGDSGRRGSSRFRGVSKYKRATAKPWMAQIKVAEGSTVACKSFPPAEHTRRAREAASMPRRSKVLGLAAVGVALLAASAAPGAGAVDSASPARRPPRPRAPAPGWRPPQRGRGQGEGPGGPGGGGA